MTFERGARFAPPPPLTQPNPCRPPPQLEELLDTYYERCRRRGLRKVTKLREVGDGCGETLVRLAAANSCDLLVVGQGGGGVSSWSRMVDHHSGLYALHHAPFPVVLVTLGAETRARAIGWPASDAAEPKHPAGQPANGSQSDGPSGPEKKSACSRAAPSASGVTTHEERRGRWR